MQMGDLDRNVFCLLFIVFLTVVGFNSVFAQASLPEDIVVEGIMFDKENPVAIINGEVLKIGDRVRDTEIAEITEDTVKFRYQDKLYVKKIESQRLSVAKGKTATTLKDAKEKIIEFFNDKICRFFKVTKIKDDKSEIDKIFNTKVEPHPLKFNEYYDMALRYYNQAEAQSRFNPKSAFDLYGQAAKAAARAINYSPRACQEKHVEREQMFKVLNNSLIKREEEKR